MAKSSRVNHTCPTTPKLSEEAPEAFLGHMSFHTFNMVLSGSCMAFASFVIFTLLMMHATHFSKPSAQVKIMRICTLAPIYSFLSFLTVCFPASYVYLVAWLDPFQSVALLAFFLLLCEFISGNSDERGSFFAALRAPKRLGSSETVDGVSWFQSKWYAILQYPVVSIIDATATCITQSIGVYCLESNKAYFGHIWLTVIEIASVSMAIVAILSFYRHLRTDLREHQPLAKLVAFKIIVGLAFFEKVIFTILRSSSILQPSTTLSYADVHTGIQSLVMCVQLVPIACFFHYAYPIKPYKLARTPYRDTQGPDMRGPGRYGFEYQGGFLGVHAWALLLNPAESFRDVHDTFVMIRNIRAHPKPYEY